MTTARFRQLAGCYWKTTLPGMIGRNRCKVWVYANGKRSVPETVAKLMESLAEE